MLMSSRGPIASSPLATSGSCWTIAPDLERRLADRKRIAGLDAEPRREPRIGPRFAARRNAARRRAARVGRIDEQ